MVYVGEISLSSFVIQKNGIYVLFIFGFQGLALWSFLQIMYWLANMPLVRMWSFILYDGSGIYVIHWACEGASSRYYHDPHEKIEQVDVSDWPYRLALPIDNLGMLKIMHDINQTRVVKYDYRKWSCHLWSYYWQSSFDIINVCSNGICLIWCSFRAGKVVVCFRWCMKVLV